MKDRFSDKPDLYRKFRPHYPSEIFPEIIRHCASHELAWDCATGNGQVACEIAPYFTQVKATDLSTAQLANAIPAGNIEYFQSPAEHTPFENHSFDLVTVGQAIHWFDFEAFYTEVRRVLKPDGVFAVLGYGQITMEGHINQVIDQLYTDILGEYWDPERKYIDAQYQTIPFPFAEIPFPAHTLTLEWSIEQLIGYLGTWSALRNYEKATGQNPLHQTREALEKVWPDRETKPATFPILLRVGKITG